MPTGNWSLWEQRHERLAMRCRPARSRTLGRLSGRWTVSSRESPQRAYTALVKYDAYSHGPEEITLEVFLSTIATLTGLTLVVASMLATGLSLTVAQILQPLRTRAW